MADPIPTLQASDPTPAVVSALEEHGAVIVEGMLDAEMLARFNAESDPLIEQARPDRSYLNPALDMLVHAADISGLWNY